MSGRNDLYSTKATTLWLAVALNNIELSKKSIHFKYLRGFLSDSDNRIVFKRTMAFILHTILYTWHLNNEPMSNDHYDNNILLIPSIQPYLSVFVNDSHRIVVSNDVKDVNKYVKRAKVKWKKKEFLRLVILLLTGTRFIHIINILIQVDVNSIFRII